MSRRRGSPPLLLLLVPAGALCVLVATAVLGPSAQSEPTWPVRRNADLTASALTGPRTPRVVDVAYRAVRVPFHRVKADATANASAICAGCTADASALQVLYLDGASGSTVDNVATAWSRCARCRATALSVQVVVVRGRPRIGANNRALAVNAACRRCHTAAAAFQVVVAGGRGPRLSAEARKRLRLWVREQAVRLREEAAGDQVSSPRMTTTDPRAAELAELERIVNDALGTTTLQRRAQLRKQ